MRILTSTFILVVILFSSIPAMAITRSELEALVPRTYPGWAGMDLPVDVAENMIRVAADVYFAAEGRWPESWAEIKEYGIVQTELFAPGAQVINPDDGKLDFFWDCTYEYSPTRNAASIKKLIDPVQGTVSQSELKAPTLSLDSFVAEYESVINERFGENADDYSVGWVLEHPGARQLAVMMLAANSMLSLYELHTNERLSSPVEFISSGWNNFDAQSVNPLAGGPLLLDDTASQLGWINDGKYFILVNAHGVKCFDVASGL
jgi:hypothetical protein